MHADAPNPVTIVANGAIGAAIGRALRASGVAVRAIAVEPGASNDGGLVIVALEDATFERLLGIGRTLLAHGRSALFVTCESEYVVAGPVAVPGVTACLECRLRHAFERNADP